MVLMLFKQATCDREGIRTPNPQSRNLIFYPVELRSRFILVIGCWLLVVSYLPLAKINIFRV